MGREVFGELEVFRGLLARFALVFLFSAVFFRASGIVFDTIETAEAVRV